jgi:hypothetical protein
MVLAEGSARPVAVREFEADVILLHHSGSAGTPVKVCAAPLQSWRRRGYVTCAAL